MRWRVPRIRDLVSAVDHVICIQESRKLPDDFALHLTDKLYAEIFSRSSDNLRHAFLNVKRWAEGRLREYSKEKDSAFFGADPTHVVLMKSRVGAAKATGAFLMPGEGAWDPSAVPESPVRWGPLPALDFIPDSEFLFHNTKLVCPKVGIYRRVVARRTSRNKSVFVVTQDAQGTETADETAGTGKTTFVKQLARTVALRAAANGYGSIAVLEPCALGAMARATVPGERKDSSMVDDVKLLLRALVASQLQRGGTTIVTGLRGPAGEATASACAAAAGAAAAATPNALSWRTATLAVSHREGARPRECGTRTLVCVLTDEAANPGSHGLLPVLVAAAASLAEGNKDLTFVVESLVSSSKFEPSTRHEVVVDVAIDRLSARLAAEVLLTRAWGCRTSLNELFDTDDLRAGGIDWDAVASNPTHRAHKESVRVLGDSALVTATSKVPGLLAKVAAKLHKGTAASSGEIEAELQELKETSARACGVAWAAVQARNILSPDEAAAKADGAVGMMKATGRLPSGGTSPNLRYIASPRLGHIVHMSDVEGSNLTEVVAKLVYDRLVEAKAHCRSLEGAIFVSEDLSGARSGLTPSTARCRRCWFLWPPAMLAGVINEVLREAVGYSRPIAYLGAADAHRFVWAMGWAAPAADNSPDVKTLVLPLQEPFWMSKEVTAVAVVHEDGINLWCRRLGWLVRSFRVLGWACGDELKHRIIGGEGSTVDGVLTAREVRAQVKARSAAGAAAAMAHISGELPTLGKLCLTGVTASGQDFTAVVRATRRRTVAAEIGGHKYEAPGLQELAIIAGLELLKPQA